MAEERVFYDILVGEDIVITPEGDLGLADFKNSIIQDLAHWLETGKNELVYATDFGGDLRKDLSKPMTPKLIDSIKTKVRYWLSQDPRVNTVEQVEAYPDYDNRLVTVVARVDGEEIVYSTNF